MDYFVPLDSESVPSFTGATLILPQPSLGSVPQLATDLIVHNHDLLLIGHLGLRDHVPSVSGVDRLPDGKPVEGVSFATQVYESVTPTGQRLVWVLPRSPVIRARREHWARATREFVKAAGFAEVLVLAGVDAASRLDEGLRNPTPLRLLSLSPTSTPLTTSLSTLAPPFLDPTTASPSDLPTIPPLPHSGPTPLLLAALATPPTPTSSTSALLIYASEGDNREPAKLLASALAKALGLADLPESSGGEWREPGSWAAGLLGEELGRERVGELYG